MRQFQCLPLCCRNNHTYCWIVGEEGWDEVAKGKIMAKADELQDEDFDRYWLFV